MLDPDELLLPAQGGAQTFAVRVKALVIRKHHHAAPPREADPSAAEAASG